MANRTIATTQHFRRSEEPGSLAFLLRKLHADPRRRGRQFEQICSWYLLARHRQVNRVWLWDEWPDRPGPDCGIDLVVETTSGELWAVQCKAVASDYWIRKEEIDSFLAESAQKRFSRRILIATTDHIGTNARRVLRSQERPVEQMLRSRLAQEPVTWPDSPDDLQPPAPQSLDLRRHQRDAVDAVDELLRRGGRAQVVMACGTGKTLVAVRSRERLDARRTLVLVPSLPLMKQTIATWQTHARKPFDRLAVCSDPTVERREDALLADPRELGVQVTTDPEDIRTFLDDGSDLVVFSTYQSSPQVAAACAAVRDPFDLVICDEAHWTAGAHDSRHATVLDPEAIPARRRLFLTATPRQFRASTLIEADRRGIELASMDNEDLYGPVIYRLSFGEAIRMGLLADYRVAVCVVDDQARLEQTRRRALVTIGDGHTQDAEALAAQVLVARAIRNFDLRRTLSFHGRVARAAEFAERLPAVAAWMNPDDAPTGPLSGAHINGEMAALRREAILRNFAELPANEHGLVSNVRCLAEGVDVPAIDSVAIIDPKRARNEIVQSVGRALRSDGNPDKIATIIVPAFVPEGQSLTDALRGSAFEPVWEVLAALREYDERFAQEIDLIRYELGEHTVSQFRPPRVHLDVPQRIGPDFAHAFNARLAREIGMTPQTQIREGRAPISDPIDDDSCDWMPSQHELSDPALVELGFEALRIYRAREGNCLVPDDHVEGGFKLGAWLRALLWTIEYHHDGDPGRYFETRECLRTFRQVFFSTDLMFSEYPRLRRELDPIWSWERFREAVETNGFSPELHADGLIGRDELPEGDVPGLAWRSLIDQLEPHSHRATLRAAVTALPAIREAAGVASEHAHNHREAFWTGFTEGVNQVSLRGCLIDRVTVRFGGSRNRHVINAYVRGWDLGKTKRRRPGDILPLAS